MILIENYEPYIQENIAANGVGLASAKPTSFTGATNTFSSVAVTGASTFTGLATFTAGIATGVPTIGGHTNKAAINSTATATAAQVATGYITSTSAAGTTITMPTGTLLGAQLNATQGTTFELYIDNTAGASTVTIAVGVNAVQSDWDLQLTAATASVTPATVTPLTVQSGVAGMARYTIMFSSPTAYTFSRTA